MSCTESNTQLKIQFESVTYFHYLQDSLERDDAIMIMVVLFSLFTLKTF